MGTEALWIPAVAGLASAGVSYVNNQQAAKKQDNELARQLQLQTQQQQQANQAVNQTVNQIAQSTPTASKQSALDQYIKRLQTSSTTANNGLGQVGAVSSAYDKSANDAALGISNYGTTQAGLASSIDAPTLQRQAEAADQSQLGSILGAIRGNSAGQQAVGQIRLSQIRSNPWLSLLAGVGQGAAGGLATYYGIQAANKQAATPSTGTWDTETYS